MALGPLEVLRKGLKILDNRNKAKEEPIDEEVDTALEPRPTYREVLQAISVINRYAGHVNDPVAGKA